MGIYEFNITLHDNIILSLTAMRVNSGLLTYSSNQFFVINFNNR